MRSPSPAAFALVFLVAVAPPHASPVQTAPSQQPAGDAEIYEKFRAWWSSQTTSLPPAERLDRYRAALAAEGLAPAEIERHLRIVAEQGRRLERERWNRILTAPSPTFNTRPNAFLVETSRGLRPGKALDVGMGQGRNAIYLAQQGWEVTGFDPADKAVAAAQEQARALGVQLRALVLRDDEFDFGKEQWDLVVLSYVGTRHLVPQVYESLRPGGLVVVEAFHRDATKSGPVGAAVVFDTNELPRLFDRFRILRYEDVRGVADFGMKETALVRLCAQKP